jgi:hypothetical protein
MRTLPPGLQAAADRYAAQTGYRTPARILAAADGPPVRLVASQPEPRPAPPPRRWWIRSTDLEA